MNTLYLPGDSLLHRIAAGPKALGLTLVVLAISLLPSTWWASVVALGIAAAGYLLAGPGIRQLGVQTYGLRWVAAMVFVGQLIFLGPEPAATNTARVCGAILLAMLLGLTTRVSDLLGAVERGLRPLHRIGVDPQRTSLLLTTTLATLPALARLAREVREAQRARGGQGLRTFAMSFIVLALKHADELGEALAARGVR